MEKIESFLESVIMPFASKLEQNKRLRAVRRAMMLLVPITLVGAIPLIFLQLPSIPHLPSSLVGVFGQLRDLTSPLSLPTFGLLGLYVAIFTAFNYAKERDVWDLGAVMASVVNFVAVATITGENGPNIAKFGGAGIFGAIVVALLTVDIMHFFTHKKKVTINLGEGVPTPIMRSFENLWPIVFSALIVAAIDYILFSITGVRFINVVDIIASPLTSLVNSLGGILLIIFLQQLLWWFGIHGMSIMSAIWMPVAFQNADVNAKLFAEGASFAQMHIFTPAFMWNIAGLTGAGVTGGLILLMMFSKSKQYKSLGALSIIPALFGINEPLIFGAPIMLNPILLIPFVLMPVLASALGWAFIANGWMNPFVMIPPYVPVPIGPIVASLDFRYLILMGLTLVLSVVLYYPFFKIMEKRSLEEAAEETNGLDELDIEF